MSAGKHREQFGPRSDRASRISSREHSGKRSQSERHHSDRGSPVTSQRASQGTAPQYHEELPEQSTRRERRRGHRQRSNSGSLPSPPTETPIISVLGDLREDIEETNFSPQHTSTFYGDGDGAPGDDSILRGRPHGPVYVESRTGFSQVSRERAFHHEQGRTVPFWGYWNQSDTTAAPRENKPVHLAINLQKCWIPFADFCHGVLAGLLLMQTILVEVLAPLTVSGLAQFAIVYSKISQLISSLVYILVSLCLVAVFDRMDVSHVDCRHLWDIACTRPRLSWLLMPLYFTALVLTFLAARTDDWLATRAALNISYVGNVTDRSSEKMDLHMLDLWRVFGILRCVCSVAGWLIISTARPKDLLLQHLRSMLRPLISARLP